MKVASWNINGVKARIEALAAWLQESKPDVACLQEIKSIDENFPREHLEAMGYNVETHGQKSFNGVAILSRFPMDDVRRGLPGDAADEQARYIEAVIMPTGRPVRVASLYLPNGNPIGSEKFSYKLAWMARLNDHASRLLRQEEAFVLAGDYNVIPSDDDVYDPDAWRDDALFQPQSQQAFRRLVNLGLTDAFRACTDEPHRYTFWDYQAGAWQKDHGIRIDHLLLSPEAANLLETCRIDRHTRGWEKPSDHVPIWLELETGE